MKGLRLTRRLRKIVSEQAGVSLVELLVAQTVFLLVMGAALSMLDTQTKVAPRDRERAFAMRELQVGLDKMVRELRHTETVLVASANQMEVELTRNGVLRRVGYKCDQALAADDPSNPYDQTYRRCVRVEGPAGAALPAYDTGRTVIDRVLTGTDIFTYNAAAPAQSTYIKTTLTVPSRGERKESNSHNIVLKDGFFMPNRSNVG